MTDDLEARVSELETKIANLESILQGLGKALATDSFEHPEAWFRRGSAPDLDHLDQVLFTLGECLNVDAPLATSNVRCPPWCKNG